VDSFLRFAAEIRGMRGRTATEAVERAVRTCFLERVRFQSIETLSKGYKHRTCFAQAILHDPPVLFLDEPTTSIDFTSQISLLEFLEDINRKMAILVITHDPTPFAATYQHIACVNRELYYHGQNELDRHTLEKVYGCPVELLGHGIPHTFLHRH